MMKHHEEALMVGCQLPFRAYDRTSKCKYERREGHTAAWEKTSAAAKARYPISRLLNTTITMAAKLEG